MHATLISKTFFSFSFLKSREIVFKSKQQENKLKMRRINKEEYED